MIEIKKKNNELLLYYTSEGGTPNWVREELDDHGFVVIAKAFRFEEGDILPTSPPDNSFDDEFDFDNEEISYKFLLATNSAPHYRIKASILGTQYDVILSQDLSVSKKTFIAHRGISIFRRIDQLISEPIVIGDSSENSIPLSEFDNLLKKFPTTTELNHYAGSRISLILKNYLGSISDAEQKLNTYLRKKPIGQTTAEMPAIYEYEIEKYEYIRSVIKTNLAKENTFSEGDWQSLMLKFILLIFPKYVAVLENVKINDYYSSDTMTKRYIDVALVDTNGHLDVIEIKKPFDDCILSRGKYRDNFTPKKELSGAIMQVEKYIFHLNKWGRIGENELNKSQASKIPKGMTIKITNPKAMIILGRSDKFTAEQRFDFELIKRKYENVLDIITYDDLLGRLDNIIEKFKLMSSD